MLHLPGPSQTGNRGASVPRDRLLQDHLANAVPELSLSHSAVTHRLPSFRLKFSKPMRRLREQLDGRPAKHSFHDRENLVT